MGSLPDQGQCHCPYVYQDTDVHSMAQGQGVQEMGDVPDLPGEGSGNPDDVVGAVLFLVSDAADLVTGTTLLIDGGWTAQ